jgi:hypothetical protein
MDIGVRWALCVLLVRLSGSVAAFVGGRKGEGGGGRVLPGSPCLGWSLVSRRGVGPLCANAMGSWICLRG